MPKEQFSVPVAFLALCVLAGLEGCTPRVYRPSASTAMFASGSTPLPSISASDAKNHIGEQAKVCGNIASEKTATSSRGEPTFINLDSAYPNQIFTILIWGDDRKSVGELPHEGEHICATGIIQDHKGLPEIVFKTKTQLSR
jgi:hypothetical protein